MKKKVYELRTTSGEVVERTREEMEDIARGFLKLKKVYAPTLLEVNEMIDNVIANKILVVNKD